MQAIPPWWCFVPRYWCGSWCGSYTASHRLSNDGTSVAPIYENDADADVDVDRVQIPANGFEPAADPSLIVGMELKNLRKVFGGGKAAVQGTNLKLYESQVLVLLGHNGAGKTTTMNMLTGLLPPSKGTAYIGSHDIRYATCCNAVPLDMLQW